eukprot:9960705-Prorocentrum_lima.AAC.1
MRYPEISRRSLRQGLLVARLVSVWTRASSTRRSARPSAAPLRQQHAWGPRSLVFLQLERAELAFACRRALSAPPA